MPLATNGKVVETCNNHHLIFPEEEAALTALARVVELYDVLTHKVLMENYRIWGKHGIVWIN